MASRGRDVQPFSINQPAEILKIFPGVIIMSSVPEAVPSGFHGVNKSVFALTGGFIAIFCVLALVSLETLSAWVDAGFGWAVAWFGLYWQLLLFATFVIGLVIAAMPAGSVRLGNLAKPEFNVFQWGSMIMCTLLAGGGVFWAAGEPMAHFLFPAPYFGVEGKTAEAAYPALAQAFLHWGFLAWAILGCLTTIMLMHYHYDKGLPLAPRTLLYPLFGERAIKGPIGIIADASCIIAVVAGTVGPIGFLGLQVSYGLENLFGIPDGFATQTVVVAGLVALYTISAITGINRGSQKCHFRGHASGRLIQFGKEGSASHGPQGLRDGQSTRKA